MVNIAGTDVPQQLSATCPRCHAYRTMSAANDGQWGFICNGCEWGMLIGAGASPLVVTSAPAAGATALTVAAGGTQFSSGQWLYYAGATPEVVQVTGAPTATNIPVSPLQFTHAISQNISVATATIEFPNQDNAPPNPSWGF